MKNKNKNKYKYTVVNYMSKEVFKNLKRMTDLHPLLIKLNLNGISSNELSLFFTVRSLIFSTFNTNPSEILVYNDLKVFLTSVLKEFYRFNLNGYVNQQNMELNRVFCVFRSLYPYYKDVFNQKERMYLSWNHELEHFHNLIILILLLEIELYIKYYTELKIAVFDDDDDEDEDSIKEKICLLKQEKSDLNKTLSGGLRVSLSRNRLIIQDRIYVGFDTEYKNIDSQTNSILCYTTASTSECLLRIRSTEIDFSLKEGKIYLPKTASLITTAVKIIRVLRCKNDFELDKLESYLNSRKDLDRLVLNNHDVIYKQKNFNVNEIRTEFHDVRLDKSQFSLKNLLDSMIKNHDLDTISNAKFFRDCVLQQQLKPVFRPECFLTAHFTAADVSLFSDFNQIKTKFTVLNKSFLTLNQTLSYKK